MHAEEIIGEVNAPMEEPVKEEASAVEGLAIPKEDIPKARGNDSTI